MLRVNIHSFRCKNESHGRLAIFDDEILLLLWCAHLDMPLRAREGDETCKLDLDQEYLRLFLASYLSSCRFDDENPACRGDPDVGAYLPPLMSLGEGTPQTKKRIGTFPN